MKKENKNIEPKTQKFSETFLIIEPKKKVKNKELKPKIKKESKIKRNKTDLPLFRSRIKIMVEGYNQNRLITNLIKEKINIYDIDKKSSKSMDIVIDAKNKQKAIAIIEKLCYNYSVIDVSGSKPMLKWLFSRIGLFAGALIFTVIAVISGSFIWKIEISGNDKIDKLSIMRQLSEMNVSVGKSKSFDTFKVSQSINRMDGISECTVEIIGTTVRISVIESKSFIPPDNETAVGDIVSIYDAEITKVIVSGGTGKVNIGDRVPAGGMLISREVYNSNAEIVGETRARGSVYGKVFFSDSTIISTTTEQIIRTGKKSVMTDLKLFTLNIKGRNKNSFSNYETIIAESYVFKNTFLPLIVKQTTFYEVNSKLTERPLEELIDEYRRDKLLSLIINAGGSEINTIVTTESLSVGLYQVRLYIEAEMLISQFKI